MDLEEIKQCLSSAGSLSQIERKLEIVTFETLRNKSECDDYSGIILKALLENSDDQTELYLHQFQALHAIAQGKDVLLVSPCGSGKTRVMKNAPMVAKLGFELRSNDGKSLPENPLGIVCCPLTSIIEDKIRDCPKSGMLSMYGSCQTSSSAEKTVSLSKNEEDFLSAKLSFVYGHPESFATEIGKKILETNEGRIFLYATDELGFTIWGEEFRPLMSSIPGSILVFSSVDAPLLCMSATVSKRDQKKVLEDIGMVHRSLMKIYFSTHAYKLV